jgi:uncharacterized protein
MDDGLIRSISSISLLFFLPALVAACGPGSAAKAARADMPTAGDALGQGACDSMPYVVDMDTRELGDLETKFAQGIVVVKQDCKSPMKILADCSVRGAYPGVYTYVGTSTQESTQSLKDADEIKTHLASGPVLAATLDAELKRGTSIDIVFSQVGTANTAKVVGREDLTEVRKGGCEGASHIVSTFYLGAFLTKASTAAEASATAEVFKQGASTKSSSSAFQEHHLGKASVCGAVNQKDNTAPVPDCKAPISIKLVPIEEGNPTKAAESGSRKPPQIVARPMGVTAKSCRGNEINACTSACQKGDAASCASAGTLTEDGHGGATKNPADAFKLYKQACDRGNQDGCAGQGLLYSKGEAPGGKNLAEADRLLPKACEGGSPRGCSGVGTKALFEEKNADKAIEYLTRACNLGYARACFYAGGEMVSTGKNPKLAFLMTKRACDALDLRGCLLSSVFPEQTDASVRQRALAALDRACSANDGEDCRTLGKWYRGDFVEKEAQPSKAKTYFTKACTLKETKACDDLEHFDKKNGGVVSTPSSAPAPAGSGGFMIKNDSPWPLCSLHGGAQDKKGVIVFAKKKNYMAKKVEPGATAPFASVPEGVVMLRFVTCENKSMGLVAFSAAQPTTFIVQAAGGKATGNGVVQLASAATYAKTPYGLNK